MKNELKGRAITLRKEGLTYKDILSEVAVSKSTLSLWLRDIQLTSLGSRRLSERRHVAQLKGGASRRKQRIEKTSSIVAASKTQVGSLSVRELWLIGLALYWAEGSKEKPYSTASGIIFSNSDPAMIRFFVYWLQKCCRVPKSRIYAHLYIHEYQRNSVRQAKRYWTQQGALSTDQITGVYFKKHNVQTKRHSFKQDYYGTLRVRVRESSDLVRKIQGWVEGVCEHNWGIV
jgi:hypothetical protein